MASAPIFNNCNSRDNDLTNEGDSTHNFDYDFDPDINFFNNLSFQSNYFTPSEIKENIAIHSSNFCLMHINVRSLLHKTNDINTLLHDSDIDFNVLAISETWLNDVNAPSVHIPNYQFIYKNRPNKQGGGVGLFIKNELSFTK